MNQYILEQLLNQRELNSNLRVKQVYDAHNLSIIKTDNKKLNRVERLIFLRIFRFVKRKNKNDNLIEIALKLKLLFKEAYKMKVFDYFNDRKLKKNIETNTFEFVELPEEAIRENFNLTEGFLVKIGLSNTSLNKYFGVGSYYSNNCFMLENLKIYMLDASPAAIVQMNKRLKLLKNKNKLK